MTIRCVQPCPDSAQFHEFSPMSIDGNLVEITAPGRPKVLMGRPIYFESPSYFSNRYRRRIRSAAGGDCGRNGESVESIVWPVSTKWVRASSDCSLSVNPSVALTDHSQSWQYFTNPVLCYFTSDVSSVLRSLTDSESNTECLYYEPAGNHSIGCGQPIR